MIDYKQEVLKVEPSAKISLALIGLDMACRVETREKRFEKANSVLKAWENAYNQLKKEGGIK